MIYDYDCDYAPFGRGEADRVFQVSGTPNLFYDNDCMILGMAFDTRD
jgi:hypothetical protein